MAGSTAVFFVRQSFVPGNQNFYADSDGIIGASGSASAVLLRRAPLHHLLEVPMKYSLSASPRAGAWVAASLFPFMLAACTSLPPPPESAVYVQHVLQSPPARPAAVSPLDDPNSILSRRSVYFAVNSAEISPSDRELLQAHANFMRANPSARLRLEGHADDRGASDFNRGLGMRRAESVRQFLRQAGVSEAAIEVRSYGKDKMSPHATSEEARARSRRVDLHYPVR